MTAAPRIPPPAHGRWVVGDIPDQTGRVAIVTGANSGIGFETAAALAERGAAVVLACRNRSKVEHAAQQIAAASVEAAVRIVELDLADLQSVRRAAEALSEAPPRIDLLINNAGVAWPPHTVTPAGVELQFAVNYLGHFALTCLLIRSSLVLQPGRLRALLQFQPASMGALPTLRAGTDPAAKGGELYGPDGLLELRGHPAPVSASRRARDVRKQEQLWRASEHLAGVAFPPSR